VNAIPYLPPGLLANCRVHPRANCQVKPRARRASRQGARTPRAGSPAAPRPSPTLRAHTARHALLLPLSSPVWRLNGYVFFFLVWYKTESMFFRMLQYSPSYTPVAEANEGLRG